MTPSDILSQIVDLNAPGILEVHGSISRSDAEKMAAGPRALGYHVHIVELAQDDPDVESALIDQLDIGFGFPDYFGQNWNAVDECINDLSWIQASGYCCILLNRDVLQAGSGRVAELFASVMADAAESWKKKGKRFCLVWSTS